MNTDDLGLIEKELGLSLPESYKNIMVNYPFKGYEYDFVKRNLIDDPQVVIKLNLDFRENGYQNKEWLKNYFIIGNIDDSLYFIDVDDKFSSVIYFLSDEDKFNPKNIKKLLYSHDFEEFIEQMKVFQDIYNNP